MCATANFLDPPLYGTNFTGFTPCGIEIAGDSLLRLQSPSSSKGGIKREKGAKSSNLNAAGADAVFVNGEQLIKVSLENEVWFLAASRGENTPIPPGPQASTPPPAPLPSSSTRPPVTPPSPAPTPSCRALIIGNAAYTEASLRNPLNDAQDLAALLRRLGCEVLLHQNADKPTMEKAVDRFTHGVPRGNAGLFFFSGHGVQIDSINYLVPIGARLEAASDVKYHAVAADWVLARMDESGMDIKLLFLDACRNNPLGRSGTRALSRGLAVMETSQGALIAYATSPGKTASDGTGRNSPFTAQLLRELGTPGRDIEVALKAVRAGVQQTTQGEQIPWVASSLTGNFWLAR